MAKDKPVFGSGRENYFGIPDIWDNDDHVSEPDEHLDPALHGDEAVRREDTSLYRRAFLRFIEGAE